MIDLTRVDIRLAVCDSPVEDLPFMMPCRLTSSHVGQDDSTMSLAVYSSHLVCYGCGFAIRRRMEALGYLLGISWYEAVKVSDKYLMSNPDAYRERVKVDVRRNPLPTSVARNYHELLRTVRRPRLDWWLEQGFSKRILKQAMIGHDGTRFTIPIFDAHENLLTIRYRRDDLYGTEYWSESLNALRQIPKYDGTRHRNDALLYPENWLATDQRDYAVVVEGEKDALRLWQEGIPGATVTNGANNVKQIAGLLAGIPRIRHLYFACDQDRAGTKGTLLGLAAAVRAGYSTSFFQWDRAVCGKDVTELFHAGCTLESREVDCHGDRSWTGERAERRVA